MDGKTILVTGGAGMVGSHVAELLEARGDEVIVEDHRLRRELVQMRRLRDFVAHEAERVPSQVIHEQEDDVRRLGRGSEHVSKPQQSKEQPSEFHFARMGNREAQRRKPDLPPLMPAPPSPLRRGCP